MSDVSIGCPKPQLQRFSYRDFRAVGSQVFATHLQMTDVYMNQADDVDEFYRQIESSVTSVLDRRTGATQEPHEEAWQA